MSKTTAKPSPLPFWRQRAMRAIEVIMKEGRAAGLSAEAIAAKIAAQAPLPASGATARQAWATEARFAGIQLQLITNASEAERRELAERLGLTYKPRPGAQQLEAEQASLF